MTSPNSERPRSVIMDHRKPLKDLVDPDYKWRNKTLFKRMQDSLAWATENFEICVVREAVKGGVETITVKPELAATKPPTMVAITFLRSLASTPPQKFADTLMRISSSLAKKQAEQKPRRDPGRGLDKIVDDGSPRARSAEAQARIDSLNLRIKAAEQQRKAK